MMRQTLLLSFVLLGCGGEAFQLDPEKQISGLSTAELQQACDYLADSLDGRKEACSGRILQIHFDSSSCPQPAALTECGKTVGQYVACVDLMTESICRFRSARGEPTCRVFLEDSGCLPLLDISLGNRSL